MFKLHTIDFSIFGILAHICAEYDHNLDIIDNEDIAEALETLEEDCDDNSICFNGHEYRIIKDSEIWGIYVDTIKEMVSDCYDLKLDKLPNFIAFEIDWEQTAKNCFVDGFGHTFAIYDGGENEFEGYWIFRTN
jgi:hypothetical protein